MKSLDMQDYNFPILDLFRTLEKLKEKKDINFYSRNLLFRAFNFATGKSFSSFEKEFISLSKAYAILKKETSGYIIVKSNYEDLKKDFKEEWKYVNGKNV